MSSTMGERRVARLIRALDEAEIVYSRDDPYGSLHGLDKSALTNLVTTLVRHADKEVEELKARLKPADHADLPKKLKKQMKEHREAMAKGVEKLETMNKDYAGPPEKLKEQRKEAAELLGVDVEYYEKKMFAALGVNFDDPKVQSVRRQIQAIRGAHVAAASINLQGVKRLEITSEKKAAFEKKMNGSFQSASEKQHLLMEAIPEEERKQLIIDACNMHGTFDGYFNLWDLQQAMSSVPGLGNCSALPSVAIAMLVGRDDVVKDKKFNAYIYVPLAESERLETLRQEALEEGDPKKVPEAKLPLGSKARTVSFPDPENPELQLQKVNEHNAAVGWESPDLEQVVSGDVGYVKGKVKTMADTKRSDNTKPNVAAEPRSEDDPPKVPAGRDVVVDATDVKLSAHGNYYYVERGDEQLILLDGAGKIWRPAGPPDLPPFERALRDGPKKEQAEKALQGHGLRREDTLVKCDVRGQHYIEVDGRRILLVNAFGEPWCAEWAASMGDKRNKPPAPFLPPETSDDINSPENYHRARDVTLVLDASRMAVIMAALENYADLMGEWHCSSSNNGCDFRAAQFQRDVDTTQQVMSELDTAFIDGKYVE